MSMYTYQIDIPPSLMAVSEDPSFYLQLGEHVICNERYKEIGKMIFRGYVFDKIIFDFEEGKIIIYQSHSNKKGILILLQSLHVGSKTYRSFLLYKNKKSSSL